MSPYTACYESIDQVIEHAERWSDRRNTLDFQTDGLVVKVDDLDQRERLGARSKSPRWTIAFKYEAEQAITRLVGITFRSVRRARSRPSPSWSRWCWPARRSSVPACTMPTRSSARTSGSAMRS